MSLHIIFASTCQISATLASYSPWRLILYNIQKSIFSLLSFLFFKSSLFGIIFLLIQSGIQINLTRSLSFFWSVLFRSNRCSTLIFCLSKIRLTINFVHMVKIFIVAIKINFRFFWSNIHNRTNTLFCHSCVYPRRMLCYMKIFICVTSSCRHLSI